MPIIGDKELDQIEAEAKTYLLEDYPINGAQLTAIINRLRQAERAAYIMEPYMRYFMDKDRIKRMNDRWVFPRLAIFFLGVIIAMFSVTLTGTYGRMIQIMDITSNASGAMFWTTFGFFVLSVILPLALTVIPLMAWIDSLAERRLRAGDYDAKD